MQEAEKASMPDTMRYRSLMRFLGRDRAKTESSGGEISGVLGLAADRIQDIVSAAERAVTDIRSETASTVDNEQAAPSRIDRERLVSELAASLTARAEELSREAQSLADVLSRASARLSGAAPPAEAPIPEGTKPLAPATSSPAATPGIVASPELSKKVSDRFESRAATTRGTMAPFRRRRSSTRGDENSRSREPSSDGLRLLATQMAVAGSTREEIETRLQDEFGVKDASQILGSLSADGSLARRVGPSNGV